MDGLAKFGTAVVVLFNNTIGTLPTRNYREGQFEGCVSRAYRVAFLDPDFIMQHDQCAVRLQLELLKPEAILRQHKIKRTIVVFGGVGATHLWDHFLKHFPVVDFIVMGEGESTFAKLVAALEDHGSAELKAIPGLAFRHEGRPFRSDPAEGACELDALPMPARHFDLAHVSLTRGCVANCTFCGSPAFWGRRVRYHSPDYFVQQLALLRARGRRFFYVSDDTFTLYRLRAIEVCRQIIARRLDISWAAISRVDTVDEEVLAWMRRAECFEAGL